MQLERAKEEKTKVEREEKERARMERAKEAAHGTTPQTKETKAKAKERARPAIGVGTKDMWREIVKWNTHFKGHVTTAGNGDIKPESARKANAV